MKIRASIIGSPAGIALLSIGYDNRCTRENDPTNNFNGFDVADINGAGITDGKNYGWLLFAQPLSKPKLRLKYSTQILNNDGVLLTYTAKIYAMLSATVPPAAPSAPWTPGAITWNTQPAFPTDPALIRTVKFRSGLSGASARSTQGISNEIIFDLSAQSLPVYGLAITILRDQGSSASSFVQLTGLTPFVLQTLTTSISITNRQSDGASNITLTTATAHNLAPFCWIQVSGVGAGYDTAWVQTGSGTGGTTIKYVNSNGVVENVASSGSVMFLATGL